MAGKSRRLSGEAPDSETLHENRIIVQVGTNNPVGIRTARVCWRQQRLTRLRRTRRFWSAIMYRKIRLGIALGLPLAIIAWGCNGEQIESGAKATATGLERRREGNRVGLQEPGREAQGNRHGLEARRGRGHDRSGHREGGREDPRGARQDRREAQGGRPRRRQGRRQGRREALRAQGEDRREAQGASRTRPAPSSRT